MRQLLHLRWIKYSFQRILSQYGFKSHTIFVLISPSHCAQVPTYCTKTPYRGGGLIITGSAYGCSTLFCLTYTSSYQASLFWEYCCPLFGSSGNQDRAGSSEEEILQKNRRILGVSNSDFAWAVAFLFTRHSLPIALTTRGPTDGPITLPCQSISAYLYRHDCVGTLNKLLSPQPNLGIAKGIVGLFGIFPWGDFFAFN